jgi:transposase
VLGELRRFLGGQKATLLWDGLGAHRSRAMRASLASQRHWLVTERLPAYAPELNPVEGLWSNLKGQELANLACDTLGETTSAAWQGIERVRQAWWLPYSFLRRAASRCHDPATPRTRTLQVGKADAGRRSKQ